MFGVKKEGSTAQLVQLCIGYFTFYVITGVTVKYFLSTGPGRPAMHGMEYLFYNTVGGTAICLVVAVALRWYRLQSVQTSTIFGRAVPTELLYIVPSGLMAAVVVPTTTIMYSFKNISVMVAMVLMRGAVIIIGRVVDAVQIRQGILTKQVYWEENVAVGFALLAVGTNLFGRGNSGGGGNPFASWPVVIVFCSYVTSYAARIYIMNYYKNTRPKNLKVNQNKAFFAIEQIASTTAMALAVVAILVAARWLGVTGERIEPFAYAVFHPRPGLWYWAIVAGLAYGIVAFFSVFIFMFKGRTATFAGLVNRLTSLVAGTTATLVFALLFSGKYPRVVDWVGLLFILVAVAFMTRSEQKRVRELQDA